MDKKEIKDKKRILIFNVNWLGDVLFSTATIRNIRFNYPESFVACVVPSRCYPVLKGNPYLDEVIVYDELGRHKGVLSKLTFVQLLKSKKFDTVFLLHRSFSRTLICRLAGISQRIGYYTKKRGFLLTQKIMPPKKDSLHRIDYYLNIIEKAGLRVEDRFTDFFISEEDGQFVERFLQRYPLKDKTFLVGINPGGNWHPKRWIIGHWAALADRLIEDFGATVVITGSHTDMHTAFEIKRLMKGSPIIACGAFNLKQSGALFKRLDLFITADTGPLHIANASKTNKIIALFGPTDPAITGPYPAKNTIIIRKDAGCKVPCYVVHCKDNRCMKAITVEDVLEKIRVLKL